MNQKIRPIGIILLMVIGIINYLNYEVPSIFNYGLVVCVGLYFFSLFRYWIGHRKL